MKVKPNWKVKCVTELDVQWCLGNCVETLLLDVDGTLRAEHATKFKDKILLWIRSLKEANLNVCLVSNAKHKKIKKIAKELDVPYVVEAEKPSSIGLKYAMVSWNYKPETTIMVGDSRVDVLAGHCAGVRSVQVDRIKDKYHECECGCQDGVGVLEWWE